MANGNKQLGKFYTGLNICHNKNVRVLNSEGPLERPEDGLCLGSHPSTISRHAFVYIRVAHHCIHAIKMHADHGLPFRGCCYLYNGVRVGRYYILNYISGYNGQDEQHCGQTGSLRELPDISTEFPGYSGCHPYSASPTLWPMSVPMAYVQKPCKANRC